MKLSVNHLKRYKEIGLMLWKYGHSDIAKQMDMDEPIDPKEVKPVVPGDASPEQLALDLERMGPTYVKLGQMLAGRPDLLPEPYLKALARLQDNVQPFPYEEVEKIILTELNVKISKAFSRFDPKPLAAASLGQVHAAALRDGREVVVKIQRPNIRPQITEDFQVLEQIAAFLDNHTDIGRRHRFGEMMDEFRHSIQQELDYVREAQNLIVLAENLKEFPLIVVPQPVKDYSTKCVLTMDFVKGTKITSVGPLAKMEMNGEALAEELFKAYLKQVLVDGVFHADPHPGNVFLTDDGRIALLDLGMVGHITPRMQENLLKLLLAIGEGHADDAADLVIRISKTADDFNPDDFRRRIGQLIAGQQHQGLQHINVGAILLEVGKNAGDNGIFIPGELTLLGKTLLQLDEVGTILDPEFDTNASIRRNASALMAQRMGKSASQGSVYSELLDMKHFVGGLPARLNHIMDAISNAQLEVKVKAVDAKLVMAAFQKIANRVTTGIVLAALIVGASLMMRVESKFMIMGYPGLAILCFMFAALGGFWLLLSIFIQDRKDMKATRNK